MNTGRLIELRGDLLMGLAIGVGRMSEFFDRISNGLHERAMRDLSHGMDDDLRDSEESREFNDLAVPSLSHEKEMGRAHDEFSRSCSFEREHEHRPDRGWQRLGDVTRRVVDDLQARRDG